jgi:hypothetical protein
MVAEEAAGALADLDAARTSEQLVAAIHRHGAHRAAAWVAVFRSHSPDISLVARSAGRPVHPAHSIPAGYEPTPGNAIEGSCAC